MAAALAPTLSRYRPIADYGALGDGRSLALVGTDGSLDWWCPGRFDGPSMFASILDAEQGGRFRIGPTGPAASASRYVDDTNVLDTEHATPTGRARVRDFLVFPQESGVDDSLLVRRIAGLEGRVDMEALFAPRYQYGRVYPRFSNAPMGLLATGAGEVSLVSSPFAWSRASRGVRRARFVVAAGETIDVVLRHAPFAAPVPFDAALGRTASDLEEATLARWRAWSARTIAEGPDAGLVKRSALALKLLQYERNGAFVAAGTTSLPEAIGGIRNWDYRFTWLRDGALTAQALADVGHPEEADAFADWARKSVGDRAADLRIMYTISGSPDLPERELPQLEGYRRSAPVRIGNGAAHQRQLDVYGELVEFLHARSRSGADATSWPLVRDIAEWIVAHWREPDQGIWEMRAAPRHFVLSKAMAWVALDRASTFARELGEPVPSAWAEEMAAIRADVDARGYDAARGGFVQAYDFPVADASNLLLAISGFVDPRDPRMFATVDRTLSELTVDGLVYRYLAEDGLPGSEATFAYCTFWLVEVLALQGRVTEARRVFDRLVARASHLGLFAEEIDAARGEHLGNYPQAFPHAGLIQAARTLAAAEKFR